MLAEDDPVNPLTLIVVDEPADAAVLASVMGEACVATFDDLADPDELNWRVDLLDVLVLLPGDAGRALVSRAREIADRASDRAQSVRVVGCEAWPKGRRLALPPPLKSRGALWVWASLLPEVPRPDATPNGRSGHQSAGKPSKNGDDVPPVSYEDLSDGDLGIVPLSSVESRAILWLWLYMLSRGGLSMMAGDGGIGKSLVLLWIAATVSTGGPWPDGSGNAAVGDVIIVSAEDRPDDTIKPRLQAMGADISRITIVKAKYIIRKEGKPPVVHPASFQDIRYWKEVFRRRPECRLFIVDPIPSYLGRGVNDSKNTEIRAVLEPFIEEIIAPLDICMIGNTHLNKSVDAKTPMHRITGSIAYANLPRNVHFVVRDPDNPERRFLKQAKCNNAPDNLPALAFRVETREIANSAGEVIKTAVPLFEAEPVAVNLGEIVNGRQPAKPGPEPKKTQALAEWLFDFLSARSGATPLAAVFEAAGLAGLAGNLKDDGKWSGISNLYNAAKLVPKLEPPRDGKRIEDLSCEIGSGTRPVKHWYLCSKEAAY